MNDNAYIARESWKFANDWAAKLSDKELKLVTDLKTPGDAGLAAAGELTRRRMARKYGSLIA